MSNYICNIRCSYRQPSGYCGRTGGYETCQYRLLHSKQTNADNLRAMSDEELAEWLSRHLAVRQEYEENIKRSVGWLDWLRQEAGE